MKDLFTILGEFISKVGFPIAVCAFLLFALLPKVEKINDSLQEMKGSVNIMSHRLQEMNDSINLMSYRLGINR